MHVCVRGAFVSCCGCVFGLFLKVRLPPRLTFAREEGTIGRRPCPRSIKRAISRDVLVSGFEGGARVGCGGCRVGGPHLAQLDGLLGGWWVVCVCML